MKRVGRWLFNFAAAVSLLLCVAMAGLWVASYFRPIVVDRPVFGLDVRLYMNGGPMRWYARRSPQWKPAPGAWTSSVLVANPLTTEPAEHSVLGFGVGLSRGERQTDRAVAQRILLIQRQFQGNPGITYTGRPMPTLLEPLHRMDLPFWLVLLLGSMLPCVWLVGHRSRRTNVRAGLCAVCGYDLRATPERCPECGTIPTVLERVAT